jgi:hypothetical protein
MLQEKAECDVIRNLKTCQMLKEEDEGLSDIARKLRML